MDKPKIILASTSQGRRSLLSLFRIPFTIINSGVDEEKIQDKNPIKLTQLRAKAKGEAVEKKIQKKTTSRRLTKSHPNIPYLIISADSMVIIGNKAVGKISSQKEQISFLLNQLSGKTHKFVTAIWIKNTQNQRIWENYLESFVTVRKLSYKETLKYAQMDDLSRYAGAYSLFNSPQNFITKIEGSLTNIIGLPLEIVIPVLEEHQFI